MSSPRKSRRYCIALYASHILPSNLSHNSPPAAAGPQPPSPVAGPPPVPATQATAPGAAQSAGSSRPRMLVAMKKPPKGAKLPTGTTAPEAGGPSPPLRNYSPPVLVRAPTPTRSGEGAAPVAVAPAPEPSKPPVMQSLGVFRPPSPTHPRVFFPPAPKSPGRSARPDLPQPNAPASQQPEAGPSISSASRAPHE